MKFYLVTLFNTMTYTEKDVCIVSPNKRSIEGVLKTYKDYSSHEIRFVEEIAQNNIPKDIQVMCVTSEDLSDVVDELAEVKETAKIKLWFTRIVAFLFILTFVIISTNLKESTLRLEEDNKSKTQTIVMYRDYIKEKLPLSYEKDFGGNK